MDGERNPKRILVGICCRITSLKKCSCLRHVCQHGEVSGNHVGISPIDARYHTGRHRSPLRQTSCGAYIQLHSICNVRVECLDGVGEVVSNEHVQDDIARWCDCLIPSDGNQRRRQRSPCEQARGPITNRVSSIDACPIPPGVQISRNTAAVFAGSKQGVGCNHRREVDVAGKLDTVACNRSSRIDSPCELWREPGHEHPIGTVRPEQCTSWSRRLGNNPDGWGISSCSQAFQPPVGIQSFDSDIVNGTLLQLQAFAAGDGERR
mmetsp:Transcript_3912/g.9551  ORF Transcript_3912/g.9551 Transcript_3912/m.9551 type:complete len:264 (-) Transcript_3912:2340-3131(-)